MMADCPACGNHSGFDYVGELCRCDTCGAQFEIDEDADCVGGDYKSRSVPGRRVWLSDAMRRRAKAFIKARERERLDALPKRRRAR